MGRDLDTRAAQQSTAADDRGRGRAVAERCDKVAHARQQLSRDPLGCSTSRSRTMRLIQEFLRWISDRRTIEKNEQLLRTLLRQSVVVVSEFGEIAERLDTSQNAFITYSEKVLPYSKEAIRQAISVLQRGLENDASRALLVEVLTPTQAQHVLSPKFKEVLAAGLAILESFVPEEDAQRAFHEWNKPLEFVGKLDPAALERIKQRMRGEKTD